MAKTAMIRARTEPRLKKEVEGIFNQLGLNPTSAINLFYSMVRICNGLPFRVNIPNEETIKAIGEVEQGKDLIECKDEQDLFNKLGI